MNIKSTKMNRIYKIIILFLLIVVAVVWYNGNRNINIVQDNYEILSSEVKTWKNKYGNIVSEKQSLQVSNRDIKKQLYIKDSTLKDLVQKYRKVQSTSTIETITKIDTITIRSERVDSANFKFSRFHKYYSISGSYNDEQLLIDSLVLPNTQNIVIGKKRGQITASVVNSNPYIKTTGMNTQVIRIPDRRFGIGVFGGIDVTGSPTVGVGVTWSLIQF